MVTASALHNTQLLMKAYEAGTEFSNSFRKTFTKNNNNQHNQTNPSGNTETHNNMETHNTAQTTENENIPNPAWKRGIIDEIMEAPTLRESIDRVGYGLSKIIDCLMEEEYGAPEERPSCFRFIEERIKHYDEAAGAISIDGNPAAIISEPSENKTKFCLWKAVDEVIELYYGQLLLTDKEVRKAVYAPQVLSAPNGIWHQCHHSAFTAIFESLHEELIEAILGAIPDCA